MKHLISSFAVCAMCLLVTASLAGPREDGSDAIERQDYATAFRLLQPLAEQGDDFAQYNVGYMFAHGLGVARNDEKAAYWYRKAAEQGDPDAQVNYGRALEAGIGVEVDHEEAMKWYLRSANQGSAMAQHNIGSMYFNGHGVDKDLRATLDWYSKAAEQGLPIAQNAIGAMYVNGVGVEEDMNKGLEWILRAANQGWPEARENAFQLYYRDAKAGNAGAMHNVAYMCLHGWSGEQNPQDCIKFYELAAEHGYAPSAEALAQIYHQGLFEIPADEGRASIWVEKFSALQDP